MNEELTVEQAQAEVDNLTNESLNLSKRIAEANLIVAELERRKQEIDGTTYNQRGLLMSARNRLISAKRRNRDNSLRNVIWCINGFQKENSLHVIDKVTPKRIFVRIHGEKHSDQYTHDGKPVGYGSHQIDIAATFGPDGPVPGK